MKLMKKYTLMLVPFNQEKVFKFTFTSIFLYVFSILFFLIVSFAVFTLFSKSNIFTLYEKQSYNQKIKETLNLFKSSLHNNQQYFDKTSSDIEKLLLNYYPIFYQRYAIQAPSSTAEQALFLEKVLNQYFKFYHDTNFFLTQIPSIFPVVGGGKVTSGFGARVDPFTLTIGYHTGVDIPKFPGTPIRSTALGKVVTARFSPSYGFMTQIQHEYGFLTTYAHMLSMPLVQPGEKVTQGQIIGYVGSTGRSVGYHLHYEVRHQHQLLNPVDYLFLKP